MKPKVLVVDDNPTNIKLLGFIVESSGAAVASARTAAEAERAIDAERPALVFMDVQLPGMDGLALTRKLRADPRYVDLPIIAVTAYAMERDERAARDAGCDGFIAKPIDTRAVAAIVADVVARAR